MRRDPGTSRRCLDWGDTLAARAEAGRGCSAPSIARARPSLAAADLESEKDSLLLDQDRARNTPPRESPKGPGKGQWHTKSRGWQESESGGKGGFEVRGGRNRRTETKGQGVELAFVGPSLKRW